MCVGPNSPHKQEVCQGVRQTADAFITNYFNEIRVICPFVVFVMESCPVMNIRKHSLTAVAKVLGYVMTPRL